MKLVTYSVATPWGEVSRLGALLGDEVVDLNAACEARLRAAGEASARELASALVPPDLLALLRAEERGMREAREALRFARAGDVPRIPREQVRLRSPLPRPGSIRDFMLVEEHVRGSFKGKEIPEVWFEIPVYYKGNPDAVLGDGDDVVWPEYTEKLDYELELCVVIGREGRKIREEDAMDYVAGYTIFNDWSARDIQFREMSVGLGPALGKDFANSFGPCLVTPDEFDPTTAAMEARINGEVWSSGTLGAMRFSFAQLIAHLSGEQTIRPGDVLGSGTIGRGCGLELDRWLRPGDVVELEVEGIGVLRNRVVRPGAGGAT
jgi:2-keto-4-pentenoate hydratase/2-oxohepta-3-ene-1,7-dioic acid hydratase in catechol pathway